MTHTKNKPTIEVALLGQITMQDEYLEEYKAKRQRMFTSMVKFMEGYDDITEIEDVLIQEFVNIQGILPATEASIRKRGEMLIYDIQFPAFVTENDFANCALLFYAPGKILVPAIIPAKDFFGVQSQFKTEWVLKGKRIPASTYTLTI